MDKIDLIGISSILIFIVIFTVIIIVIAHDSEIDEKIIVKNVISHLDTCDELTDDNSWYDLYLEDKDKYIKRHPVIFNHVETLQKLCGKK